MAIQTVNFMTGVWEPIREKMFHIGLRVKVSMQYGGHNEGEQGMMQCVKRLEGQHWCLVSFDHQSAAWIPAFYLDAGTSIAESSTQTEAQHEFASAQVAPLLPRGTSTVDRADATHPQLLLSMHNTVEYFFPTLQVYGEAGSLRNIKVALNQARSDMRIIYSRYAWKPG